MPKKITLSLTTAELLILSASVVNLTRGVKRNPIDGKYYDIAGYFPEYTKTEISALRSIARKLGVK